ncbi:cysteine desulfurase/sulfurtransferase TusA family protein [Streptomyces johnsoniae]|uniref:Aminotransferase class V-fold PLP-dependent enzyme n=1 Tax=Streptomyces johnsoniae TaxID=3075532 RepID=A0ABU2S8U7_9ACTN|nr:aminotransferase class V-fold PLP-dependent enzyme [Streptomyces sp. DSM 41886]MDT0444090.1 aminotransferase class V-fold PLP-dependent enzyme [Streptomyces sp. DSM 41886]
MPYFDAASSLPPHPVARQALLAAFDDGWADPSRLHREGRRARMLLDAARETAAEAVGCRPDELTFTSSGTRALHTGMAGALAGRARAGRHLLVSAVEHSAVLHAAEAHRAAGGTVAEIGVDRGGLVAPADVAAALAAGPAAALVCVQSANHEVGTRQPVADIAEIGRAAGVPLLVDAAQSLPWGPVAGAWSLLAASAHKWGGPGGVGLLAVRKGVRFAPASPVDERESGRAPGFENIPAVVAAAASLRAFRAEAGAEAARLAALVDRIRERVPRLVPDVEVVGEAAHRLPHVVTFSCLHVDGEALLHALDRAGFAVSSGSSCTSSTLTPSHVLRAMGVLSEGNVRVSLPPGTTEEDVERFLAVLPEAVAGVRAQLTPPTVTGGAGRAGGAAEPAGTGTFTVDSLGKRCPVPVIELAGAIGRVAVGGVVTVLADDAAARLDIPAWCTMRGQEYLGESPHGDGPGTAYRVRRLV